MKKHLIARLAGLNAVLALSLLAVGTSAAREPKCGLNEATAAESEWFKRNFPVVKGVRSSLTGGEMVGAATPESAAVVQAALPEGLPPAVDNSARPAFPPIRSQGALASCAAFATTYYQLTYETALARGLNASRGEARVLLSPKWTYNFINGGKDEGASLEAAYSVITRHGAPAWAEMPYDNDCREWASDGAVWRQALSARPLRRAVLSGADADSFIANLKAQLVEGRVLVITTYNRSWVQQTVADDPATAGDDAFAGQKIASYMKSDHLGGHALTVVGYNDELWVDLNGDGRMEASEKGAFKLANSWGTSDWNRGFRWVSYDAVRQSSAVSGTATWPPRDRSGLGIFRGCCAYLLTARPAYEPALVGEFTLKHACRSQLSVALGLGEAGDFSPRTFWTPGALLNQGGNHPLDGASAACEATFVFDFSDLDPEVNRAATYYLSVSDNSRGAPTEVSAFRLTDAQGRRLAESESAPANVDQNTAHFRILYPPPPFISTAATASPNPVRGRSTVLAVGAVAQRDGAGALTYAWSALRGPAPVAFEPNHSADAEVSTAGFSAAGEYLLRVTVSDGVGQASSEVAVRVEQTLTALAIRPASVQLVMNQDYRFAAAGTDQFGAEMEVPAGLEWSADGGGRVSGDGTFAAFGCAGGPYTVTTCAGEVAAAATVNVVDAASIQVSPAQARVKAKRKVRFTAVALDETGRPLAPQPVFAWSLSGGGRINAAGVFSAARPGGPYKVQAAAGTATGSALVTVQKDKKSLWQKLLFWKS